MYLACFLIIIKEYLNILNVYGIVIKFSKFVKLFIPQRRVSVAHFV